jgi:hypothetical protein
MKGGWSMSRYCVPIFLVLLCLAPEAWCQTDVQLYSDEDWQYFGPGANGQRRSQRFSPTESTPTSISPTDTFTQLGFRFALDGGEGLTGWLQLFAWDTDYATTIAGPVLAQAAFNLGGPVDVWLPITASSPQLGSGQYLLSLLVDTVTGTDFGLRKSTSNDGGPNNDAYNAATLKTDREYQVRIYDVTGSAVDDWSLY